MTERRVLIASCVLLLCVTHGYAQTSGDWEVYFAAHEACEMASSYQSAASSLNEDAASNKANAVSSANACIALGASSSDPEMVSANASIVAGDSSCAIGDTEFTAGDDDSSAGLAVFIFGDDYWNQGEYATAAGYYGQSIPSFQDAAEHYDTAAQAYYSACDDYNTASDEYYNLYEAISYCIQAKTAMQAEKADANEAASLANQTQTAYLASRQTAGQAHASAQYLTPTESYVVLIKLTTADTNHAGAVVAKGDADALMLDAQSLEGAGNSAMGAHDWSGAESFYNLATAKYEETIQEYGNAVYTWQCAQQLVDEAVQYMGQAQASSECLECGHNPCICGSLM